MARITLAVVGFVAVQFSSFDAGAAINVACVGDSITQNSGWCEALGTKLGSGYKVSNFGVSSTTLLKAGDYPYWTCAQYTPSHDFAPNIVVIMLGTNDSKPQNWSKKASFVADYGALIDSYANLSSHPSIYINLPPPAGTNSYSISGTVIANEIIPLVRQVATDRQLPLIDIFTAFGGTQFDASLFGSAQDQVHPNAKGAQVISNTVYDALMANRPSGAGGAGSGGANTGPATGYAGKAGNGNVTSGGGASSGNNSGGTSAARPVATGGNLGLGGRSGNGGQSVTGGVINAAGSNGTALANSGGRQNSGGTTTSIGQAIGGTATANSLSLGGTTGIVSPIAGGTASTSTIANTSTGNQSTTTGQSARGGQSSINSSAGGAATSATTATSSPPSDTSGNSGCGCRVAQRKPYGGGWSLILLAALALRRTRRSRR